MVWLPVYGQGDWNAYASAVYIYSQNNGTNFYNCLAPGGGQNIGTLTYNGNLGTYLYNSNTLRLEGGELKTFKTGTGNVCSATMWYRVYRAGNPGGPFLPVNLPFYCDCTAPVFPLACGGGPCNAGDQKWQNPGGAGSTGTPIDLTNRVLGRYTLEVYFEITGSDSGGGCGSTKFENNNGANWFMDFTIDYPLPVTFAGLKAGRDESRVRVEWTVTGNDAVAAYQLERSYDGRVFRTVYKTEAMTGKRQYTAWDAAGPGYEGTLIYRVTAVAHSGLRTYSPVIAVPPSSGRQELAVVAVPGNSVLQVRTRGLQPGIYRVQVVSASGQIVENQKITITGTGSQTLQLLLRQPLFAGWYRLVLDGAGTSRQASFLWP